MVDCDVCCSRLNDKKANKQVECPYCHYRCCQSCIQRYFLNVTQQNCMRCRMIFNDKFIQSVLPKAFINDELARHKQSIFMMREREILKMYEHLVPKYKRRQKDLLLIKKLSSEIHRLEFRIKQNKTVDGAEIVRLKEQKQAIIDNGFHLNDGSNVVVPVNNIRKVLGPKCPIEGCKGHTVMNGNNYRCQICESDICKKCLSKMANQEHICNAADVKSLELILHDSKPCPGCGMMIFRESGCPAMFCINCTISFNWYSLEIEAPSHNPHYYEWLEKKRRIEPSFYSDEELLLEDQNNLPEYKILSDSIRNYKGGQCDFTLECHRLANEIKDIIPIIIYDDSEMEHLRVKYLVGEIAETKYAERMTILQEQLDYSNHQRQSVTAVYELLKLEFWRLVFREYTIDDFIKNARDILDAYSKDQIETADRYGKKYTVTRNTYAGARITYIIMKDFEDSIKQQKSNQNQAFVVDDTPDYWSDYDSDFD